MTAYKHTFYVVLCHFSTIVFSNLPVTKDGSQNIEDIPKAVRSLVGEVCLCAGAAPEWKNKNLERHPDPGPESSESPGDEVRFVVSVGTHGASKHFRVVIGI